MHSEATPLLISAVLGWFGKAYTSTYVLDETLTLTKAKLGGREAVKLADSVTSSRRITTVRVEENDDVLGSAFEKFRRLLRVRGLSFTDCTTLALGEKMGIRTLLSFDKNFKPFVSLLLGEGYRSTLSRSQEDLLGRAADKLGISLK